MANPTTLGYLITVDGTTIVNHTTLRAVNVVQNTATVNVPTYVLPSQVKVYYNGTADSTTTPGTMSQDIICTSGGIALYGTLSAKIGNYVTSVLSPLSGADLTNTGTVIMAVDDITPQIKHDGDVHIRVTIEVIGDWA